ncbi:hypothetical protein LguiB_023779 [Lonicera macranthoides]
MAARLQEYNMLNCLKFVKLGLDFIQQHCLKVELLEDTSVIEIMAHLRFVFVGKQYFIICGRITLTARQWSAFRNSVPAIEDAITKMESRIRSEDVEKHIEAAMPSSTASALQEQNPNPRKQIESETSNLPSSVRQTNGWPNTPTPFSPQSLVPIEPTRLNGKNYYFWAQQIEFFLNQLKIAYVLTEPCPHIPLEARKWTNDDYICRRNILNSLSDHLFDQYSKKSYTAKELWEELKFAFNEDFGAKRSDVHQYIHFEMVDGISVLEQVQILNNIADSVIASGMFFNENFHVSSIVSKLPPSWKDCRAKLMREEFLPFNKLMHHLRVEEESRSRCKKEGPAMNPNLENRVVHSKQGHPRKSNFRGQVIERHEGVVPMATDPSIIDDAISILERTREAKLTHE